MADEVGVEKREHWSSKQAFVLAAIGSAIGLGNVWRFPRICAQNGGFAFLIAYVICLFAIGIPILILELSMGKRTQRSTPGAFRFVHPKLEWFGWMVIGVGFIITVYYAVVMSWCCNYTIFATHNAWGGDTEGFFKGTFLKVSGAVLPKTFGGILNPEGWQNFSWRIFLGSVVSWAAIVGCIWKGVKSVSKVVYVTVVLPWLLLAIFVIRGVTLPGAWDGLSYYLSPKGEFLGYIRNPATWGAAVSQVFFSISVGFGIMFAYGSFLDKKTNVVRNSFIIAISDALTAMIAGLAVFGCLGYLSPAGGGVTPISAWEDSSLGIAFVAYPKLISAIPGGAILGPLFFLMLLFLAIDSAFSLVEGGTMAYEDKFGWSHHRAMVLTCGAGFLLGVPLMFTTGLYWFDIIDHWMNSFGLMIACLIECIVFGYIYKSWNVRSDLLRYHDQKLGPWFDVLIMGVAPLAILGLIANEVYLRYKGSYEGYGRTAEFYGGWLMLILIGVGATVFTLLRSKKKRAFETVEEPGE